MIPFRFLPPAEQEVTSAALFYDNASQGLGNEFLDDVNQAISLIRRFPFLGSTVALEIRRAFLRNFPFAVIYVPEDDCILVVAIAHLSREPFYWKTRLNEPSS